MRIDFVVRKNPLRIISDYIQKPDNYKYRVHEGLELLDFFFETYRMKFGAQWKGRYWYSELGAINFDEVSFDDVEKLPHVLIFNAVMGTTFDHNGVLWALGISQSKAGHELVRSAGFAIYHAGKERHWHWHRSRLADEWRKQLSAVVQAATK